MLAVAAKELQARILDFVRAKSVIQRLNDVQDAASHRCDSRLRGRWERDRDARAQGRFQGVVGLDSFTDCSVPLVVRLASIARENYTRR